MKVASFLQSLAWEQFQQATGKQTVRVDGVLAIEQSTPLGSYWYVPRAAMTPAIVGALFEQGKATGTLFIRVDPETIEGELGNIKPFAPMQPQDSLIIDLQPADQLLQTFHEKTRYNIRLSEKKGVTVTESVGVDSRELDAFLALSGGTSDRQGFHYHAEDYYRKLIETLGEPKEEKISASVLTAWHEERPIASLLAIWTPQTSYYLHGASSYEHRPLMGPHALQWRAMQLAYERGCSAYDLWGIAPEEASEDHPWRGITRFKLGYGGRRVHYPDSFAVVIKPMHYQLYNLIRSIRRKL